MALRVAQLVTSLARGGAQATVLGSSHQGGREVDITVLAGPDDPGEGTFWADAAGLGIRTIVVPNLHRSIDPRSDGVALRWLVRWLREVEPDVLHTHSAKAGLVGRMAAAVTGTPVVHTVHGWSASSVLDGRAVGARRWAMVEMERRLARRSAALVVVTPLDADEGLRLGIGTPGQYRVVRSGIDLADPRRGAANRATLRRRLGVDDHFVVGTVARLADQKDLETMITGFGLAAVADGRLLIIGDGPRRVDLVHQAEALGLSDRVSFLGHRDDAAMLVAALDVFVSTSRWEGLPRTIIEAIAAEVPVIATPVGGVREIIDHGVTGVLIPIGDPDAVAGALRHRLRHPHRAEAMAVTARSQIEAFTVERMRADLVALWHEVADRPAPSTEADPTPSRPASAPVGVG